MNDEQLDAELADWFSHRRKMDAAHAPAFADVWAGVQNRHQRAHRRVFLQGVVVIAAMLVLPAFLISVMRMASGPNGSAQNEAKTLAVPWQTAVLISEWRAPTHFLFTTPDAGLESLAREAERWNRDSPSRPNRIN
jgi:hypothetical protein